MKKIIQLLDTYLFEITFVIAAGATSASFVLSDVVGFVPCTYCWYQRILMFPLPLILGAAVLRADKKAFVYVLPLSVIGMFVSAYHSLIQWGFITEEAATCSLTGPSCAEPEVLLLGFLTIPFGAFLTFAAISVLMVRAAMAKSGKNFLDKSKQPIMQWMILGITAATVLATILVRVFDLN